MTRFRKGNFTTVPNKETLRGKSPELQAVFYWLCDHANDEGYCFPSYERLAECAGVHRTTVIRKVQELIELGILVKTVRTSKVEHVSNLYEIIELEGGGSTGLPPSSPERLELNPLNKTNTTEHAVSSEIGISSSQSSLSKEEDEEDSTEEDTTYDYNTDEDGNPIRGSWGKTLGGVKKPHTPHKHEELLRKIETVFKKKFISRPKQLKALTTILANGFTKDDISEAIDKMNEKPYYQDNGWDMMNVLSEISRK